MEKVKAGIIGLGFMSVAHIKAYRQLKDVEIVAVCNPSGRRLDGDLSDVFGNVGDQEPVKLDMNQVQGYRDVEAFLNHPELQLVDICSPTATHSALVLQALEAGKHVLCEKPITRTSDEAKSLVEAIGKHSTYFMPAMCLRFWPEWLFLKKAIDEDTYGKALGVRFRRVAEPPGWSQDSYLDGENREGPCSICTFTTRILFNTVLASQNRCFQQASVRSAVPLIMSSLNIKPLQEPARLPKEAGP